MPDPWNPNWVVPPSETLAEVVRDKGFLEVAEAIDMEPGVLMLYVCGMKPITEEFATLIGPATGTAVPLWLNLQANYDAALAVRREAAILALLQANSATMENRPGGALRGAASHSATTLMTELNKLGWEVTPMDPMPPALR